MKKSFLSRITAISLCLFMLVTSLIACAKPDSGNTGDTTTAATDSTVPTPETSSNTDENGFLLDDLSPDLNFGNSTVRFLVWSDVENNEFEIAEQSDNAVDNAIYLRNKTVERRLGVTFEFEAIPGNYGNQRNFISTAQTRISAGSSYAPHIMAAYSLTSAGLVANGLTYKLNELENLDFSKPWWPDRLLTESMINGNYYLCSGDISTNMLHKMHAIFFNKDMTANNGHTADSLYDKALAGDWTLDDLFSMTADVYEDRNNSGTKDRGDLFGLYICDNYFDVFYYASDLIIVDRDADGTPKISDDFTSEKAVNLADKVGSFFANRNGAFFITDFTESAYMSDGNAMMIISRCDVALKKLRFSDNLDYGVLPVPKYDKDQKDYVSCLAFPCSLYVASKSIGDDAAMVGAVLEAMGSEGYRKITPVLFEATMKTRYASDGKIANVYDIIRSSVTFDLGRIFYSSLGEVNNIFRKACSGNTGSYMANASANRKSLQTMLNKLIADIGN